GDDGSCSSNLLSTTTTDNSGFYSSPFYRTGGVLCVKISPIPGGNTTVYDETLKKDINLTSSSSLNLTHIVNESTLTENKRGGIFISPISQILNKRVQALLKQNPGANLANATKKASKEIVIRFGLNQGLGQRNFNTKSSLSDESYPELDQLNFSTINPSDPISKKFLGILAGFSKMANNYKTGSSTGPDDLDAIINAFASDMEDGLFDGKDSSGASVTIGSTGKALGADALTNQLLPALKEFINSGGVLGTGTTSVSIDSSLLNTIQFQDSTTIISNIDLSSTATITAPTSIAYSASSFTLTQGTLTNIVPTISGTPTTCTSSPSLPSGLILNPITCAISGSPLIVQTATNYIITASNSGGSISTTISITTNSNTVFSGATPFSLDTRYGDFEFNGNFYFKIRVSSTDYLVKIKNDGSIDSTFGTSGKLATPVNSTHFLSCGNKIFGIAATGGNYNIYKFNDTGAGSFSLSVTSSGVTTGNGLHQMYCIDSSIYYTVIDNGVPATGTGLMKFNTVSENFDIQFKNYSNAQIYHVMKDSTNQLWIYRSTSPQVSKIDASLNLVAGGEKTISM
ncbi:MAG: hypothetical protein KDK36_04655, partial [Leptospiraceae bacterium]|nr:hypothetical protein [Leptospiraceae bacterium]